MASSSGEEKGRGRGLDDTMDLPGAPRRDDAGVPAASGARMPDYDGLQPIDPRHYVVEQQIARGGMGRIFAARDRRLGRAVAIKVLLRGRSDESRRFEQEARITARLQHPAIVNVYEAGTWTDGEPFYAMKMVSGRSLAEVVAEKRDLAERLAILPHMIAVADALAYAHSLRVIHRDLKPSNVLVGSFGETVVIDWGLAKDLDAAARAPRVPSRRLQAVSATDTSDGAVMGTPAWMSPEKARGEAVDEHDDVYALGALLYYVLSGVPPYAGESQREIVDRVLAGPPTPLEALHPGVPADLAAVVTKAMAREPAARYRSAAELATDLKRFQTGQLVGAHRYSPRERVLRFARRHRTALAVAVAAIAVLAMISVVAVSRVLREKRAARTDRRLAVTERKDAEEQREAAEEARKTLFQEQGRQALLEHHAGRALIWLSKAYGPEAPPSLRFLLAEAWRPFHEQLWVLKGHAKTVRVVAFDREDGDRLASASEDGTVRIWDTSTGQMVHTLSHGSPVTDVDWCEGQDRIVTASEDGARIWDTSSGHLLHALGPGAPTPTARYSFDCQRVVTTQANQAFVWDATQGRLLTTISGHEDRVVSAEFSPADGRSVLTASWDDTARVWSPAGMLVAILPHKQEVYAAHYDEIGERIVTASRDGTAALWSAGGERVRELEGHHWPVYSAEFSPQGRFVVTVSHDGTARVWDAVDGRVVAVLGDPAERLYAARFSSSDELVVTASWDGRARVYSALTGVLFTVLEGHADKVFDAEFDPHGNRVATASADGTVRLWRASAESVPFKHDAEVVHVAFAATGERLLAGADRNGYLWTIPDRKQRRVFSGHTKMINTIALSPDGTRVVTASDDGTARIWDSATGQPLQILRDHGGAVTSAAFSPDGARIVTSSADHTAIVWDAGTGAVQRRLTGHGDAVTSAAFDPTGKRIVTASWDGTAKIWEVEAATVFDTLPAKDVLGAAYATDGRILTVGYETTLWKDGGVLRMDRYPATCAAISPDGLWVVTGGLEGIARIFDATTGRLLGTRSDNDGPINSVGFTPDGKQIIVAAGRYARLWSIPLEDRDPALVRRLVAERVPPGDQAVPSSLDP